MQSTDIINLIDQLSDAIEAQRKADSAYHYFIQVTLQADHNNEYLRSECGRLWEAQKAAFSDVERLKAALRALASCQH